MKSKKWKILLLVVNLILFAIIGFLIIDNNRTIDIGFKVPDYYVISSIDKFEDTKEFYQKSYDWYKEVADSDGVYIVNTMYFSDDILRGYTADGVYEHVPSTAFWYFVVSPSYLKILGIDIDAADTAKAQAGARVFLIPDTLTTDETAIMERFLTEESERALNGKAPVKPEDAIQTNFYLEPKIEFATYTPVKEYFTFPSQQDAPLVEKAPILLISTPNNMTYFESESLFATGVNSYIKINGTEILNKYLNDNVMQEYGVKFSKISGEYRLAGLSGYLEKGINSVFEN